MSKRKVFAKTLKAKRTGTDGIVYQRKADVPEGVELLDSQAEYNRYRVLENMKAYGVVKWYLRQVMCDIGEPGVDRPYRVDFLVAVARHDGTVDLRAEDVKGCDSPTFRRHVKQWIRRGGIPLVAIRNGKTAEVVHGGSERDIPVREGCKVDGITYPNLAIAQAAYVAAIHRFRSPGDAVFFRRAGGFDFLVADRKGERSGWHVDGWTVGPDGMTRITPI